MPNGSLTKPSHPSSQSGNNPEVLGFSTSNNPCAGIKITGPMTANEFRKLFECLNRKGALEPLKPIIIQDTRNTGLFVRIYNETFGMDKALRDRALKLLKVLHDNGGLDDLLTLASAMISEFIDTPNFNEELRVVLTDVLNDDLNLLEVFRKIVDYPEIDELFRVMKDAFDRQALASHSKAAGEHLRSKDIHGKTGAQNLVQTLSALFKLTQAKDVAVTLEDLHQLNEHHVARNVLEVLFKLQQEKKLEKLASLVQDLSSRTTASFLTDERRELLKKDPDTLSPKERETRKASEELLKMHPASDLVALIKATSTLHRKFMEDERQDINGNPLNQNLLASVDVFLHNVKTVFDSISTAHNPLGPNHLATERIITYKFYTNVTYRELSDTDFHAKSTAEKIAAYKGETDPRYNFYRLYIEGNEDEGTPSFTDKKAGHVRSAYFNKRKAEKKKWTPRELRALRKEARKFARKYRNTVVKDGKTQLQLDTEAFIAFLDKTLANAVRDINERKLFLNYTAYDFLLKMQDIDSIALFLEKSLLNLDNEFLDKFIDEIIHGLVKDFFEFHRPVDDFMRSQYKADSNAGQSGLSYTVLDLFPSLSQGMPMKDQMTIIGAIEATQVLERLLIKDKENRVQDIREVVLPFIKAINSTGQDKRILNIMQFMHSGKFKKGHTEEGQLANQMNPLVSQIAQSGFLLNTLNLLSALGKNADPVNRFLTFLTLSKPKRKFLSLFNSLTQSERVTVRNHIEYRIRTLTQDTEIDPLTQALKDLGTVRRDELIDIAQSQILVDNPKRLLTPVLETGKNLLIRRPIPVTNLMTHLGTFLTADHINRFMAFLERYDAARDAASYLSRKATSQSFLTKLIKRDEMGDFIQVVNQMLADDVFQSTHTFLKEIIDEGEMKRTIHLLTSILLQGGN